MLIDDRFCDAGSIGNVIHRGVMKAVLPKDRKGAVEDVLATHRGRQSELSHVEVKVRGEKGRSTDCFRDLLARLLSRRTRERWTAQATRTR